MHDDFKLKNPLVFMIYINKFSVSAFDLERFTLDDNITRIFFHTEPKSSEEEMRISLADEEIHDFRMSLVMLCSNVGDGNLVGK